MSAEQIAVTVNRVNGNGFTVRERTGWLNVSKYAAIAELPQSGQRITVALDKAGFVRAWSPAEPDAQPTPEQEADPALPAGRPPTQPESIARSVALKAAIDAAPVLFERYATDDLLGLAARFEAWLLRPAV